MSGRRLIGRKTICQLDFETRPVLDVVQTFKGGLCGTLVNSQSKKPDFKSVLLFHGEPYCSIDQVAQSTLCPLLEPTYGPA